MHYTEAEQFLMAQDEVMAELIPLHAPLPTSVKTEYFEALCESIISQQLSVKASDTIFKRFFEMTDLKPARVQNLTDDESKVIGLSGQKRRYLADLAAHFVEDSAVFNHLDSLSDDDVIAELTQVKGIGVWTAQMFLLFTLGRPDIFAPDDRGLQLAIMRHYALSELPKRSELEAFAEQWAPYRSTASRYLWRSLNNAPL